MRTIPVIVDSKLRVDGNLIGLDLAERIFDELDIPNQEHQKAKNRELWNWEQIPEFHQPYELDGDTLVLPRGYALRLKQLLRKHDIKVDWIQRTRWRRGKPLGVKRFSYRKHQPEAVAAIRRHRQGIYKAPTGSGKSATGCALIWQLQPKRALILVDKINLVSQWHRDITKHLRPKFEIGFIGAGEWTESRITVATVQTVWKYRKQLEQEGWFDSWDIVILDECHHVTAATYGDLMARFSARYRLGFSATPDKTGEFELAEAILGPVFHEDSHQQMRKQGTLVKPDVGLVHTTFEFDYYGDHKANKKGKCEKPGCKITRPYHGHRNNYQELLAALIADEQRNGLICEILKVEPDHVWVILTDRTTHIDAMISHITQDDWLPLEDIYVLTGKQNRIERDKVLEDVSRRGKGFIFATIADEGVDLPLLDRILLVWPTRNARKIEQQIGRGMRTADDKSGCLVFDLVDPVGPLMRQSGTRIKDCYIPLELDVTEVNKPIAKKGLGRLS